MVTGYKKIIFLSQRKPTMDFFFRKLHLWVIKKMTHKMLFPFGRRNLWVMGVGVSHSRPSSQSCLQPHGIDRRSTAGHDQDVTVFPGNFFAWRLHLGIPCMPDPPSRSAFKGELLLEGDGMRIPRNYHPTVGKEWVGR